jgi:steroid 5-alpha reductase family enzyme
MRQSWRGSHESLQVYGRIYLTQALLATVVSLPVIIIMSAPPVGVSVLSLVCLAVWLGGFIVEVVADRQLRLFIRQSTASGRLMMDGLWRYSRHPNYFGELVQWWALGLMALTVPLGWLGLLGPLLLSFLIVYVSGIPPLEKAFAKRPGWVAYVARTSALIPWVVKKETKV